MTLRFWKDPRDGRHWRVRRTGPPPVLVFTSEDELISVPVDFSDSLADRRLCFVLGFKLSGAGDITPPILPLLS